MIYESYVTQVNAVRKLMTFVWYFPRNYPIQVMAILTLTRNHSFPFKIPPIRWKGDGVSRAPWNYVKRRKKSMPTHYKSRLILVCSLKVGGYKLPFPIKVGQEGLRINYKLLSSLWLKMKKEKDHSCRSLRLVNWRSVLLKPNQKALFVVSSK